MCHISIIVLMCNLWSNEVFFKKKGKCKRKDKMQERRNKNHNQVASKGKNIGVVSKVAWRWWVVWTIVCTMTSKQCSSGKDLIRLKNIIEERYEKKKEVRKEKWKTIIWNGGEERLWRLFYNNNNNRKTIYKSIVWKPFTV